MRTLLCFGLGYSAEALARRFAARGWRVIGTATTDGGVRRIEGLGYEGLFFDGSPARSDLEAAIGQATHVLVSAPPGADGDPVLAGAGHLVERASQIAWIGYLSTVGVFGDRKGGWVDEATPPAPLSDRSRRRVIAEEAWLALGERISARVQVFRLAGIYGPDRSVIDDVRAGTARRLIKKDQVFNRIHVEDIASVLEAAIERGGRQAIYNVTDDEPAPPQDVVAYAAELIGAPMPPLLPFESAVLSPMAQSFYAENKRVRNGRLRQELGVELAFPTYREGLAAIAGKRR